MTAPTGSLTDLADRGAAQREARAKPFANRRFLLVTMPAGPFASRFALRLRRRGADVLRVILNGGDLVSWGAARALWPRVPRPLWSSWLDWQLFEHSITDVVVFGDSVSFSAEALACARARGARTWILENGYNRPDWVTIEANGVNANSCLPRDPDFYRAIEAADEINDAPHVGAIQPYHTMNMIAYFTGTVLGGPVFPTYRYPYATPLWPQIFGHVGRYAVGLLTKGRRRREAEALVGGPPFFLACLQREGDTQLLEHSEIKTNTAFMAKVIASFAARAPRDHRLVFKNHPLDPGVDRLARRCAEIARRHKVGERVVFLEGGVFAPLARASRGLVSVNSTAAYAALGFGTPVKLLGRAIFDIQGLTDPQPLEGFWKAPAAPDLDLYARFRRHLSRRTQVYGSFHNPKRLDATADRLAEQLILIDRGAFDIAEESWRRVPKTAPAATNVTSIASRLRAASPAPGAEWRGGR